MRMYFSPAPFEPPMPDEETATPLHKAAWAFEYGIWREQYNAWWRDICARAHAHAQELSDQLGTRVVYSLEDRTGWVSFYPLKPMRQRSVRHVPVVDDDDWDWDWD